MTNSEVQELVESYIMPVVCRQVLLGSKHEWEIRKEIKQAVNAFLAAKGVRA